MTCVRACLRRASDGITLPETLVAILAAQMVNDRRVPEKRIRTKEDLKGAAREVYAAGQAAPPDPDHPAF